MGSPYILTQHAIDRTQERLNIDSSEDYLAKYPSIINITYNLKKFDALDSEHSCRLLYLKDHDCFAVLILLTKMSDNNVEMHIIKTVYSVDTYEKKSDIKISDKDYKLSTRMILPPVQFREWELRRYGLSGSLATHRLLVWFEKGGKPRALKVRSTNCSGFKIYENVADVLAHPGAITAANNQLSLIGKTLNDRLYMRYDSWDDPIKLIAKEAKPCPYCGMAPLSTDVSAEKGN